MEKKAKFKPINWWLRTTFTVLVKNTIVLPYFIVCLCVFPLPLKYRYKVITSAGILLLWLYKIFCRSDYRIQGIENIPKNRNGVILSKHQSDWETIFLPTLFPQTAIVLKHELLWVPIIGWGLAMLDPIAIKRNHPFSATKKIIEKGKKCLAQGRWVLIFPEGTRVLPNQKVEYGLGGARLAIEAGYPIIPIAHNAGEYWARDQFVKKPGIISVIIGPLIETTNRSSEDVIQEVKNWIEKTMEKIS